MQQRCGGCFAAAFFLDFRGFWIKSIAFLFVFLHLVFDLVFQDDIFHHYFSQPFDPPIWLLFSFRRLLVTTAFVSISSVTTSAALPPSFAVVGSSAIFPPAAQSSLSTFFYLLLSSNFFRGHALKYWFLNDFLTTYPKHSQIHFP